MFLKSFCMYVIGLQLGPIWMLKEMERSSICTVQLLETCISIQKILIDRSYKQPQQQEKTAATISFVCTCSLQCMLLYKPSHWEVESLSPTLNLGWPWNLLWALREEDRIPDPSLKRLFKPAQLPCEQSQASLLKDKRPCGREISCPIWGPPSQSAVSSLGNVPDIWTSPVKRKRTI